MSFPCFFQDPFESDEVITVRQEIGGAVSIPEGIGSAASVKRIPAEATFADIVIQSRKLWKIRQQFVCAPDKEIARAGMGAAGFRFVIQPCFELDSAADGKSRFLPPFGKEVVVAFLD